HAQAGRGRRRLARRLRLSDDFRAARVRRLERGGVPGGRSARRRPQHGAHPRLGRGCGHRALPAGQSRVSRGPRAWRHQGIQGGRRGRNACHRRGEGRRAARGARMRVRADHDERRDLYRRQDDLRAGTRFPLPRHARQLARQRQHAGQRAAAAGSDHPRAGGGERADARRLQRHGCLYLAGVLDLLPADRAHAVRFPQTGRGGLRFPCAAVPGGADCLLPGVRLHAVFQHQLRALRGAVRNAGAGRPSDHGARHPAVFRRAQQMTLTELRYIVAVARERHFGRAAETCFVSQPTLSVAVKKLEDELGVTLFERGPGEVSVTPAGTKIVEQAQRVLEEASRIRELAAAGRDPLAGSLRLGAIYTIGPYLLPKLIPILRKTAPALQLLIQENFTHVLGEELKSGRVDVILVALPFDEPGIVTRAVYDEPFMVAVPKGHPWEGRKRVTGGSLETIRQMVAGGVGVTVLPATSTASGTGAGDLIRILPFARPIPTRRVGLAWRRSFPRPEAIEALRKAILACNLPQVEKLAS